MGGGIDDCGPCKNASEYSQAQRSKTALGFGGGWMVQGSKWSVVLVLDLIPYAAEISAKCCRN